MFSRLLTCLVLLLSLLLMSCRSPVFCDLNELKNELEIKDFPGPDDYPESDAIILSESHDVDVRLNSYYEFETEETVHKVIKLLRDPEKNSTFEIRIHSGEKVDDISARTIKPDGRIIELSDKDIFTIKGEGEDFVFYSDVEKLRFTFPGVEEGCIVEFYFRIFRAQGFIYDFWKLQNSHPTLRNQYRLKVPKILTEKIIKGGAGWSWNYRVYNHHLQAPHQINNMNPEQKRKSESVSYLWKVSNVPAFCPEPSMPAQENYYGYVKFAPSSWKSWDNITDWYYNRMLKPLLSGTPVTRARALQLTDGAEGEMDKIKRIFDYVRKIRYVAISLGDGGIRPFAPEDVMKREYGDCKDKSTLLVTLLRSAGIKALPVLALNNTEGELDESFPCWKFNHMIVKAETKEGKTLWMDPTVTYSTPGFLPSGYQAVKVLVMDETGRASIELTPASAAEDNNTEIKVKVEINEQKEALYNIAIAFKGEEEVLLRSHFNSISKEEIKRYCSGLITDDYINTRIQDVSLSDPDLADSALTLKFSFSVQDALEEQCDLFLLRIDPCRLFRTAGLFSKERRNYPLDFEFPYTVRKSIEIILPENKFSVRNLPGNLNISDKDFSYSIKYSQNSPEWISADGVFQLKNRKISAGSYRSARAFFNTLKKKSNEKLILIAPQVHSRAEKKDNPVI